MPSHQASPNLRYAWSHRSIKIEDLATDLNGLTWALEHAGVLAESLSAKILGIMRDLGRAKDFEMSAPDKPPPTKIETLSPEDHPGDAPVLRDNFQDMSSQITTKSRRKVGKRLEI